MLVLWLMSISVGTVLPVNSMIKLGFSMTPCPDRMYSPSHRVSSIAPGAKLAVRLHDECTKVYLHGPTKLHGIVLNGHRKNFIFTVAKNLG
jgi:hypothetical protein